MGYIFIIVIDTIKAMEQIHLINKHEGVKDIVDLPFDDESVDNTWYDQYGIQTKNLLARGSNGEKYDDHRYKVILFDGEYDGIVGRKYVVYPNPEAAKLVLMVAEKKKLTLGDTDVSHHGKAQYWQLVSEDIKEQIDYRDMGDVVHGGVVVRNGVGVSVALGCDLFTMRVRCSNGCVGRGVDMGFKLRHIGNIEVLQRMFIDKIDKVLETSHEMLQFYKKMATQRMNKKIAQAIAKAIPHKALPDSITYDKKTHEMIGYREDNLWESFNQITERLWHDPKSQFARKAGHEQWLHRLLVREVRV